MNQSEFKKIFQKHELWLLSGCSEGERMNLHRADFSGLDLEGLDFTEAVLPFVNLKGAKLANAILYDTDLRGANLEGAYLSEADFSCAYLADANFTGASLSNTIFASACLADAKLSGAYIHGANFEGANLSGTILEKKKNPADSPITEASISSGEEIQREISRFEKILNKHGMKLASPISFVLK